MSSEVSRRSRSTLASVIRILREDPVVPLALAVGLLALLRLSFLSHGLRGVCFDDEMARAGWIDQVSAAENLGLDYSIGRFYAQGKFAVLGWLQAGGPALGQTVVRAFALAIAAFGVTRFCSIWLKDHRDALVGSALFLASYPFYEGYQAFFSNPLLLLGLGAACVSASFVGRDGALARAASLGLLGLALVCHELFVLFTVLHAAMALRVEGRMGKALRRLAPEIVVVCGYVALNFALRDMAKGDYEGVRLSLAPLAAVSSLLRQTVSALPGFEIWFDRAAPGQAPLRSADDVLVILSRHTDIAAVLLAGAAGLLVYRHCFAARARPRLELAAACLFLLFLVALPNVLTALTVKYQVWAMQRRLPYYYGALGLGFGCCALVAASHLPSRAPRLFRLTAAMAVVAIVLAAQTMNTEVAQRLRVHPIDTSSPLP